MIFALILIAFIAAVVLAVVVLNRKRKPTAGEFARDIAIGVKRDVRDSLLASKDAAEDVRNAVRDSVK